MHPRVISINGERDIVALSRTGGAAPRQYSIARQVPAVAFALFAIVVGSLLAAEDPALEQYLDRLGLTELRLTYSERQLERETAPARRAKTAVKLADAYAIELAEAADDPPRFAGLKERAEKLLAEFPEARNPGVQAALLQAEYQQAEALVIRWMENPNERQPLKEAGELLATIQPRLAALHAELAKAEEAAAEALDRLTNEPARQAAEAEMKRQRVVAVQADYFAGWAAYYLGVARLHAAERAAKDAGQKEFTAAKLHLCRVLDVSDEKDYAPIEVDNLGLDSIWRARTVIGLGLTETALSHVAAANRVFGWLEHASVPPAIRDQAAYWQLQGLLNAGLYDEASKFAAKEIGKLRGGATPGKSSLCIAAIHGGAARGDEGRELIEKGIAGLARMRQFETADKLIAKYDLDSRLSERFSLLWLRGRREYLSAEKKKQADGFKAAVQTLSAALALPEARRETVDAAQARYYLAWSRYRLDEIDAAAPLFHEAAVALAFAAPEVASQAAWMHCTCLVQAAAKDKRQVTAAISALESFRRDYPSSEESQQVEILVARLRQNQLAPQEAIRELAAIKPSDAGYAGAQYEICQLQYQLWNKAKTDTGKAQALAGDLLKTVDGYLTVADKQRDAARRLKAALLAVDVLVSGKDPSWQRARALLDNVAAAAAQEPNNSAALEYQYRRMQLAEQQGNTVAANAAARPIVENGVGTPYELPALAVAARAADEAVKAAADAQRPKQLSEARRLYVRLVLLLGDTPSILASNKNALAAASKLAQYDEELEHWADASERLSRLVQAQPKDRRLLRRAGLASFQAGQYQAALEYWRALAAGLTSGSDDWFEAKYFQLACLEKTDRTAAQSVLKQFRVLFPEVNSAAWRDKFAALAERL